MRTDEPHAATARLQIGRKLRLAAQLEVRSAEEVDRLSLIAAEQGWTNSQIAEVVELPTETIRVRRRKGWFRKRAGRKPDDIVRRRGTTT